MSYTEIYKFKANWDAESIWKISNSHRWAMLVWRDLYYKYFWKELWYWQEDLTELFNEIKGDKMSNDDKIILASTDDFMVILKKDLPKLIDLYKNYKVTDDKYSNISLSEQAELIEKALDEDTEMLWIIFNQTSVNYDFKWDSNGMSYTEDSKYNEMDDEEFEDIVIPYNILSMNKHITLADYNI